MKTASPIQRPRKSLLLSIVSISLCLIAQSAFTFSLQGLSPEEAGLAIAKEADLRDKGFGDSTADLQMTLRNRNDDESLRHIRNKTLEVDNDGDKSISIFDEPADVKGTVSLTHSHGLEPDDQWLYLPAIKRVKRINSKNKSGPFMGSEFAFEDISSQEVEKYTYKYLGDEVCGDMTCYKVERYPAYEYSGYTRQIGWMDTKEFRLQKVEFYDRKDTLLKTLAYGDYQQFLGKYWRPHKMHMVNHQTGKSTDLLWSNYKFSNDLTDRDFDQRALTNIR